MDPPTSPSKPVYLDPKGDGFVILPNSIPPIVVSMHLVSLASIVLGRRFDSLKHLQLTTNENPVAVGILLRVFHYLDPAVPPGKMTPELLAEIADLCLEWQCLPALGPYPHRWMAAASDNSRCWLEPWPGWLKIGKGFCRKDITDMVIEHQAGRWWKDLGFANLENLKRVIEPRLIDKLQEIRADAINYIGKVVREQLVWLYSQEKLCTVTHTSKEESEMCSSILCGSLLRILQRNVLQSMPDEPFGSATVKKLTGRRGLKCAIVGLKEHPYCREMVVEIQMSLLRRIENHVSQIPLKHQVLPPTLPPCNAAPANYIMPSVNWDVGAAKTHTPIELKVGGGIKLDDNSELEATGATFTVPTTVDSVTEPAERSAEGLVSEPNIENYTGESKMPQAEVEEARRLVESLVEIAVARSLGSVAAEDLNDAVSQCIEKPEKIAAEEPGAEVVETTAEGSAKPATVENSTKVSVEPNAGVVCEGLEEPVAEEPVIRPTDPVIVGQAIKPPEMPIEDSEPVDLTFKEFGHGANAKVLNDSLEADMVRVETIKEFTEKQRSPIIEESTVKLSDSTIDECTQKLSQSSLEGSAEKLVPKLAEAPTEGRRDGTVSDAARVSVEDLLDKLSKLPPNTMEKLFEELKIQFGEPAKAEAPVGEARRAPVDSSFWASSDAATGNDIFSTGASLSAAAAPGTRIVSTVTGDDNREVQMVQQKSEEAERCEKPAPTDVHTSDVVRTPVDVPITESPTDDADVLDTSLELLDRLQLKDTPDLYPNSASELLDTVDPESVLEEDQRESAEEGPKGYSGDEEQKLDSDTPDENYDSEATSPGSQASVPRGEASHSDSPASPPRGKASSAEIQEAAPDDNGATPDATFRVKLRVPFKRPRGKLGSHRKQTPGVSSANSVFSTQYGIDGPPPLKRPRFGEPPINVKDSLLTGTGIAKTNSRIYGFKEDKKGPLTLTTPLSPSASTSISTPRSPVNVTRLSAPNWTDEVRQNMAACLEDPAKKRVVKYLRAKYRQVGAAHLLDIVHKHKWHLEESEEVVAELHKRICEGELALETSV